MQQQLETQRTHLDDSRKHAREEFQNLAQSILEAKSKTFSESTEKNLGQLLGPLKEKLGLFEKKVDENYASEAKERHTLKSEIARLVGLNEQLGREAQSLTQALKGDSKVQGDWGELVLTRILEASGLREGQEYTTQAHHLSDEGDRFRPDVVIQLPDGKHLVIDSKVSLTAYELHSRLEPGPERERALAAHLSSLNKHVTDLAEKQYAKLKGINSPEFVFLFVPIEAAYLLAMQTDPELAVRAMKKNISIVTATTLFTSLRTVASIWKVENQNRNALEIASEGAKLYDKFVGFLEDFEKVGKTLESGHAQYTSAMGKLKEGPGNVFKKIENLRELGAAPGKRIRSDLLE
jgi:DNA recombination protein RmuC